MCGLVGLWRSSNGARGARQGELIGAVTAMNQTLRHRGPDAEGFWSDSDAGIAFGHNRLSVIDLSVSGAQPMASPSGRYTIVFNGEIYNHPDLRRRLGAVAWRGRSDTETLLAAIEAWGLAAALDRASGMFALALWDASLRRLYLARDRMGEKPLYVATLKDGIAFASEIKAFRAIEGFEAVTNPQAVAEYLRFGYVPDNMSIHADVEKVAPGTIRRYDSPLALYNIENYWSLDTIIQERATGRTRATGDFATLSRNTEITLGEVIGSQMLSDVPLGSFLSGGIDSTLVTALMQVNSDRPVRSFSIGFNEARFNESEHAAAVARHLGTEHTEFIVSEADALELIPDLAQIYDEPFADSSQIPTTLLCRLARAEVTVALTGDGGDEVFGGYNRHVQGPRLWRQIRRIPRPLRRRFELLARLLHRAGHRDGSLLRRIFRQLGLPITTVDKLSALAPALARAECFADFYQGLISTFLDPTPYLAAGIRHCAAPMASGVDMTNLSRAEWMMVMDSLNYLPGDILVKVDRAAMSASLETRAPFLDRRVVELSWSLPHEARISDNTGKRVLRDILRRHVPSGLVERPKQGFSVPLDQWLRGRLRDWAEALITPDRLAASGLLQPEPVRALWSDHLTERANNGQKLWAVLMLLSWTESKFNN